MKNSIFQAVGGLFVLAAALAFSASSAHAQVYPTTCPTATVFYPNGYSMSPCVPSYPQGYPNITVYPGNNGAFYNSGGYTAIQTNPFTNPMYSNNGLFAPGMTQTGPTYYYPPAPTYPNGYYYGNNGFYNGPGNTCFEGCGNGPSGNYHGGYYGGNAGNGYWYGGNYGGGYGPGYGGYWPH